MNVKFVLRHKIEEIIQATRRYSLFLESSWYFEIYGKMGDFYVGIYNRCCLHFLRGCSNQENVKDSEADSLHFIGETKVSVTFITITFITVTFMTFF